MKRRAKRAAKTKLKAVVFCIWPAALQARWSMLVPHGSVLACLLGCPGLSLTVGYLGVRRYAVCDAAPWHGSCG